MAEIAVAIPALVQLGKHVIVKATEHANSIKKRSTTIEKLRGSLALLNNALDQIEGLNRENCADMQIEGARVTLDKVLEYLNKHNNSPTVPSLALPSSVRRIWISSMKPFFRDMYHQLMWPMKEKEILEFKNTVDILLIQLQGIVLVTAQAQQDQQRRVEWLSKIEYWKTHVRLRDEHCPNTAQWIFEHEIFISWRNSRNLVMWLCGNSGTGKSILTSQVIQKLLQAEETDHVCAYFYCQFGRSSETENVNEILCCILAQVLYRGNPKTKAIEDELTKRKDQQHLGSTLTEKELKELIYRSCDQYGSATIAIDGLDECPFASRKRLIDTFTVPPGKMQQSFRFFASSRQEYDIQGRLENFPSIILSHELSHIMEDVKTIIEFDFQKEETFSRMSEKQLREIRQHLTKEETLMLRYVKCQLQEISQHEFGLDDLVVNLPRDLTDTYFRVLSRMEKQLHEKDRVFALKILQWLVAAKRPLSLEEIISALEFSAQHSQQRGSVPSQARDILRICGSLVYFDPEDGYGDVVRLSHASVRDFLLSEDVKRKYPQYACPLIETEESLATTTLKYLLQDEFATVTDMVDETTEFRWPYSWVPNDVGHIWQRYPLLKYAAMHWVDHVSNGREDDPEIYNLVHKLLMERPGNFLNLFLCRSLIYEEGSPHRFKFNKSCVPVHYLVSYGPKWLIARFMRTYPHCLMQLLTNHKGDKAGNSLIHAIRRHDVGLLRMLIQEGGDMEATTDTYYWTGITPLQFAVSIEAWECFELLLSLGAKVNHCIARHRNDSHDEHILNTAARKSNPELVLRLLHPKYGITAEVYEEAIHGSLWVRHLPTLKTLVKAGVSMGIVFARNGKTPLLMALELQLPRIAGYILQQLKPGEIALPVHCRLTSDDVQWAVEQLWFPLLENLLQNRPTLDVTSSGANGKWRQVLKESGSRVQVEEDDGINVSCVSVVVPPDCTVLGIIFRTISHDQGWASEDEGCDDGTYAASWTWLEVGLIKPSYDRATSKSHPYSPRFKLQANIRAEYESRRHYNEWRHDTGAADRQAWFSQLKPGDEIAIFARALYPGWENYVDYASIELWCKPRSLDLTEGALL